MSRQREGTWVSEAADIFKHATLPQTTSNECPTQYPSQLYLCMALKFRGSKLSLEIGKFCSNKFTNSVFSADIARGGHSHMHCSHSYDRGQKVVNRSKGIFAIGQAVKDNFCNLILQSNGQEPVWSSSKNDGQIS